MTLGGIFALIVLGYTMVYGIIRLINSAHGEFFAAGGYMGVILLRDNPEIRKAYLGER